MNSLVDFKHIFPIDSVQKVYDLFEEQLRSKNEPDLTLFSIVVGAVENNLTNVKTSEKDVNLLSNKSAKVKFPSVDLDEIKSLYERFVTLMRSGVDAKLLNGEFASRELVKRVADVVWNSLTRSYYKDKAHLQSIYSFLTGNKLDCFGVAFAVTAGCQVLGKKDVHLALSEDHAWVVFGEGGTETAEVTWHGKGNEDKRGRSVGDGVLAHSWLYVAGKPVVCSRVMELAALVSSINPSLTATIDVHEVAQMQHKLLWLLYNHGHLDTYPMAIGNLADLEEYLRKPDCSESSEDNVTDSITVNESSRPDSAALYAQAIRSARTNYDDRHVYPYTLQGGYYHRKKKYKEAFNAWACAGDVIRHYNYSRDDEEIYKEFSEIANDLIPQLMKAESSGHSARSILKDPECFASLLRFYDGICKWEEGSQTPILHIGWAKPLVMTISKFDAEVRAQVNIICSSSNEEQSIKIKEEDTKTEKKDTDPQETNDKWNNNGDTTKLSVREQLTAAVNSRPRVTLYSHKMAALKPLLLAERLNTHALQLQLTAQSQLQRTVAPTKRHEDDDHTTCTARAKRARRER